MSISIYDYGFLGSQWLKSVGSSNCHSAVHIFHYSGGPKFQARPPLMWPPSPPSSHPTALKLRPRRRHATCDPATVAIFLGRSNSSYRPQPFKMESSGGREAHGVRPKPVVCPWQQLWSAAWKTHRIKRLGCQESWFRKHTASQSWTLKSLPYYTTGMALARWQLHDIEEVAPGLCLVRLLHSCRHEFVDKHPGGRMAILTGHLDIPHATTVSLFFIFFWCVVPVEQPSHKWSPTVSF